MKKISGIASIVLALSLALTGCGSDEPADSSTSKDSKPAATAEPAEPSEPAEPAEPAVAPATGETITGSGYSYVVPEGWGKPPTNPPGFAPDSLAVNLDDKDGFSDNVNVIKSPAPGGADLDQIEEAGKKELNGIGATDITVHDRLSVAGHEAGHLSSSMTIGKAEYIAEQYFVGNDAGLFVVTFSFSKSMSDADRVELAESVLATWKWA